MMSSEQRATSQTDDIRGKNKEMELGSNFINSFINSSCFYCLVKKNKNKPRPHAMEKKVNERHLFSGGRGKLT